MRKRNNSKHVTAELLAECTHSEKIESLLEMLKAISDANRLRILCLLSSGEKCVCDIEESLGISQPLVSHHLSILPDVGMVKVRKSGVWCYYSLVLESIKRLDHLLKEVLEADKIPSPYPRREDCDEVIGRV